MARRFLQLMFATCLALSAQAQQGGVFTFSLNPLVNLPVAASADRYTLGAGGELVGEYSLPSFPAASVQAVLGYNLIPVVTESSVHAFSAGVGPSIRFPILGRLSLGASLEGGVFAAAFAERYAFSPYLQADAGLAYRFAPAFSLGVGAGYKHLFAAPDPFLQAFSVHLDTSFHLGGKKRPELKIARAELQPVFPVFFKYYDDNPLGKVALRNEEKGVIRDVTVSLFVRQYMASPKQSPLIRELKKGEEIEVPLYALFTENVLEVTEGSKVQADIIVEYLFDKEKLSLTRTETMRINDRNAMTWEDDRRAAAFVTAKDPAVLRFAKQVAGLVRREGAPALEDSLLIAMALHEALDLYGIRYVPDPTTPYVEYSQNAAAVDFLQFPNQTLQYRAGDCDDLSILYCALLESVGVETAFVTAPGHIFMAFAVSAAPDRLSRLFSRPEDFIVAEGKAWIPVEVTSIGDGFLKAWDIAAREWRRFQPSGEAVFYGTRAAWRLYEAVGFQAPLEPARLPDDREVLTRFQSEKQKLLDQEMMPQVKAYQDQLKTLPGNPRTLNALGTVYARYGLFAKAEEEFRAAIGPGNYAPALANMGNVQFLKGDMSRAQEYYRKALELKPDAVQVLIGLANTYWELERYEEARQYYDRARQLDPTMAAQHSYLESARSGARGADAQRREVDWDA